jgi:hypothetical protein
VKKILVFINIAEWAERGFCKNCGSHLFYKFKDKNHYFIPAGIFDRDDDMIFDMEVFIDEKPKYYYACQ